MNKPPRKGDLVENGSGTQGIVVSERPCADPTCAGEIQVRLVQTPPGTQPLCYLRREIDVIAPASNLVVAEPEPADETPEAIRLTADVVLFGEFDGAVHILLIERGRDPFKGRWALPGGHADAGEDTADAAYRELTEETGISVGALVPVGAYGAVGRDPRGRYVTFAYAGRMAHRVGPTADDDAARAEWVRLDRVVNGDVPLAFDHLEIVRDALRVTPPYSA